MKIYIYESCVFVYGWCKRQDKVKITKKMNGSSFCRTGSGMISANFSRDLIHLFNEMYYWERLRFEVPHYAAKVYKQCETLRMLRENVLLVVCDYNRILLSLDSKERALFKERIRIFGKKIRPGMTKLTWVSTNIDVFVNECRTHAQKLGNV